MPAAFQPPQQKQILHVACHEVKISFASGQKRLIGTPSCCYNTPDTPSCRLKHTPRMPPALQDFPLFFTAGVHPHNAKDCTDSTLQELRQLAAHERCVAIGG